MVDIASALMNPEVYDEVVNNVRMVQTHISWIFLTGRYVYKVKKPVNFLFLDFSTLEKRKFYCEKELELNKRLAPDMYLEVVPINEFGGEIKIKGNGRAIEYAVKMKELPQESMMLKLLEKNKIGKDTIERIVKNLIKFHSKIDVRTKDQFDSLNAIKFNWEENFNQVSPFVPRFVEREKFDFIKRNIDKFFINNRDIFEKRISEGKIRECHGDLHSGNIFITDKIYIFDAIEFSERLRVIDVANEVAFLAMDLDFQKRPDLSNYFVEKYIEYSKDKELKKILNFYKCYRAFVRGKINFFRFSDKGVSDEEKLEAEQMAKKYFDLSYSYAKNLNPRLVIMCGLIGTGKSIFAKSLAKKIKAEVIRSDVVRKDFAKISPNVHKFEEYRKGIYSEKFTDRTYKEMIDCAKKVLLDGTSCILDATFSKKKYRKEAANLAKELNLPFFIVECTCPENIIKKRLERRMMVKSVSDGRWEIFLDQKKSFEPVTQEEGEHIVVDTTRKNKILEKIFT